MFLAIVSLVIASCSSPRVERKPSDLTVSISLDTTVICQEPITAARYDCNKKLLKDPKLVGMKEVKNPITLKKDTVISGDSLIRKGYGPVARKNSSGSDFSWLGNLLKWIGAILALILALLIAFWILRELYFWLEDLWLSRRTPRNPEQNATNRHSETVSHSDRGGQQRQQNYQQNQQEEAGNGGGGPNIHVEHIEHVHIYVNARGRNRGN